MARTTQTKPASAQRKFLRGAITATCFCGPKAKELADEFPAQVFLDERVRTFLAASSWFWYCYTCFQQNEGDKSGAPAAQ